MSQERLDVTKDYTATLAVPFCKTVRTASYPKPASYPASPNTLGEHLRRKRLDRGHQIVHVAALLGVTTSTVVNWEANRHAPNIEAQSQIIGYLGFDPSAPPTTLALHVLACRRQTGLTGEALAQQLDVDPNTVSRVERGHIPPWKRIREKFEGLVLPVAFGTR